MRHIRTVVVLLALLIAFESSVSAATFYISTSGSDAADCSSGSPCRTLAHGSAIASAGDTVIVRAGVYFERIKITNSGTASAPIAFVAEGQVQIDGATLLGDWAVVQGFRVDHGCGAGGLTGDACRHQGGGSSPIPYGFWLEGDDLTIRDNFVTGTFRGGAYSLGLRNRILNNRFIRTGHPAILLTYPGAQALVEGNEIADVMPYAGDQDGIRLFGAKHVIRNNYIHDIYSRKAGPHRDSMQTFDLPGPDFALVDVLIEGNTIVNTQNGGMFSSSNYGLSRNVVWRNNRFINAPGHMVQAGVANYRFEGNTFYLVHGFGITSTSAGSVQSNRFLWVRGTYPISPTVLGSSNWAYPNPTRHSDAVRTEPGGVFGVRPPMPNIPLAVFVTVADGTGSTLHLAPADALQLKIGSIIEIDADGFPRSVTAIDAATGRVDFMPAINGQMSRVPGSTLPTDYGNWRIAAVERFVALWSSSNVTPDFGTAPAPGTPQSRRQTCALYRQVLRNEPHRGGLSTASRGWSYRSVSGAAALF